VSPFFLPTNQSIVYKIIRFLYVLYLYIIMELRNVISKSEDKSKAVMTLYGGIGSRVDGHYFAKELDYLSDNYDEIVIRINSEGGSVFEGLSIVGAINNSQAHITAVIEGVAASMAGVVPMFADKVVMNDYARIMVHNPSYGGRKTVNKKEAKALDSLRTMLVSILSKRGMEEAQMAGLMDKETWLTAEEAKDLGLVDEIISTGKKTEVDNMLVDIAACNINSETFSKLLINKNENKMKVIAELFNKSEIDEAGVVAEVQSLQSKNETLEAEKTALEAKVQEYEKEKEDATKKEAETIVDNAIKAGFYKEDQKQSLLETAESNLEAFKTLVGGLQKPASTITSQIDTSKKGEPKNEREGWTYDDYRKKDPQAFAKMSEKEQNELIAAYEATIE
jgi:ATP-dependent protease ClpP protease subunit